MAELTGRHSIYVNAEEASAIRELISDDGQSEHRDRTWHPDIVAPVDAQLAQVVEHSERMPDEPPKKEEHLNGDN